MKQLIFLLLLLSFIKNISGQNIIKSKKKINSETISYSVMQTTKSIKGIVFLLPGWGEEVQSIFKKTLLPKSLSDEGYITIVPKLKKSWYANDKIISSLNHLIKSVPEKYHLKNAHIFIGGLSSGGGIAISYAEYLLSQNTEIKLKGVFAIDSPLDFERLFYSSERLIKSTCGSLIKKEGYRNKAYLENILNGSPKMQPDRYLKYSSFSASNPEESNGRWLKNIPVRLYTEPDLDFVQKTYCAELMSEDINAVDLQRLHQFLVKSGNTKSEYIATKGKGFHSWNIIDPQDFLHWIMNIN